MHHSAVSILVLTILGSNVALLSADTTRIKVDVYYEHLCPDSIRWVSNQLAPNYDALRESIVIEFIPFGKSRSINNGEQFECQHGPLECEGNRIQSCVLHQIPDQDRQVSYVACQMNFNADPQGWECAFRSGIDLNTLQTCVEGTLGTQLQLEAERRTKQIAPSFVPTIVLNGQFNQSVQDRAFKDFLGLMCDMTNNNLAVC
ncbi:GILT-like protein 1 [Toxorhynchites rutilus septentrionalis]|uniref:GILT-like protein 1 n=1 Tax=Toxorhynchites rutilus septentrionalis TaxID=329112 RepID=UPI0024796FDC|nr:GILT-like protein 1 [Toxorhynchites rutilus septentrionalis]